MISRAVGIIMTIMDICKKHEAFIKTELEDMRNIEERIVKLKTVNFSNLRELFTIQYTKSILLNLTMMILDDVMTSLENRITASDYHSIIESLCNINRCCDLNVANDEWISVLAAHIPESFQDGIRNIWENEGTLQKWLTALSDSLHTIYPYIGENEKESLSQLYHKYVMILSGKSLYDLIEEKGSC